MARPVSSSAPRIVAISPDDESAIDLKNPGLAALLSWLVPGLGQIYQGRSFKGWILLASLVGTFLAGMWIGDGKVVYASWGRGETRWAFLGQAGIGFAALPALGQAYLLAGPAGTPRSGMTWFAPPIRFGQAVSEAHARRVIAGDRAVVADDFRPQPGGGLAFRPLHQEGQQRPGGQLSLWHRQLGRFFDVGTLYTVLAGLFNILVVYDAWAGPMRPADDEESDADAPASGRGAERKPRPGRGRAARGA